MKFGLRGEDAEKVMGALYNYRTKDNFPEGCKHMMEIPAGQSPRGYRIDVYHISGASVITREEQDEGLLLTIQVEGAIESGLSRLTKMTGVDIRELVK